jgi:hypothetical protein
VGFGKHFQEIIFKQPGLTFVMNFFKLHGAKIRKVRGE